MRLLVDTHLALWWLANDPRLPERAAELIESPDNEVPVSSVSAWEGAIKVSLGKLRLEERLETWVSTAESSGLAWLPFTPAHAVAVAGLAGHHRDPFDRALVAQSLVEPLRLLTADKNLALYGETIFAV